MQTYNKITITASEIVPTAKRMREAGVPLAMIHGFINDDGLPEISYEYEIPGGVESYQVVGEKVLPSISGIYDLGAEWPERELMELMDITFEGVDASKRLFMPDSMLDGQGQILVTPMKELIEKAQGKKEQGKKEQGKKEQDKKEDEK
ncbi:MAG: NADH-quinone oxidoreductase subunit C [Lachnospiraceae bacterium]